MNDISIFSSHTLVIVVVLISFDLEHACSNSHDKDTCNVNVENFWESIPGHVAFLGDGMQFGFVGESTSVHRDASHKEVGANKRCAEDQNELLRFESNEECN